MPSFGKSIDDMAIVMLYYKNKIINFLLILDLAKHPKKELKLH
jgi:hypothetical protein